VKKTVPNKENITVVIARFGSEERRRII